MKFQTLRFEVPPIDRACFEKAQARQRQLAKPFGALGRLESLSAQIAGVTGELFPALQRAIVVFSADNGVFAEGVTPIGQDVTMLQTTNMTMGKAGIGALSAHAGAKLMVVDIGMVMDSPSAAVIVRKIRRGTSNICLGPAMSEKECERAFAVGAEMAEKCRAQGFRLVGAGEMGVGNTTTSSAVLCALTGLEPDTITGRGAGLTDEAYANKLDVIRRALDVNGMAHGGNAIDAQRALDIVRCVGGFDIAAMAGFYLRAAELRMIPVVDGFIATAAALVAAHIDPNIREYFVLSHRSAEPGYDMAARMLGQIPLFDLGMRLGEGTGCPLAFHVIEAAACVLRDMATFDECFIDNSVVADNWEDQNES